MTTMDLTYSPEQQKFRAEVREFVRASLPRDISQKVLDHRALAKDDLVRWQKILCAQRLARRTLAQRVRRLRLVAGARCTSSTKSALRPARRG